MRPEDAHEHRAGEDEDARGDAQLSELLAEQRGREQHVPHHDEPDAGGDDRLRREGEGEHVQHRVHEHGEEGAGHVPLAAVGLVERAEAKVVLPERSGQRRGKVEQDAGRPRVLSQAVDRLPQVWVPWRHRRQDIGIGVGWASSTVGSRKGV